MVFLDFFEALLGYAEVYVVEVSEQPDMSVMVTGSQQHADMMAVVTPEQTAVPSITHALSAVEQVSHLVIPCVTFAGFSI